MRYGFIGCGNMGGAIARALSKTTTNIVISDPSEQAKNLSQELCCTYTDSKTLVNTCDCVILAVKPQVMKSVLAPLQEDFKICAPLVITIAAGLQMDQISEFLNCSLPIIRLMPNTPVAVGKGMIQYCHNELVSQTQLQTFLQDMQYAGILDPVPENLIDAASALSGCGPAYMYMFAEALADGAVACGLPRQKAIYYAAQTMAGAAEMLLQSGKHPGELKDAVCSPGGSTIAGVKALERNAFRGAVMECVAEAYEKNKLLGK